MKKISVYACLLFACLFTAGAQAAGSPFFMGKSIIVKIPNDQRPAFEQAVKKALDESPDGQTSTWTSVAKGKRDVPVSVTMTPTQSVKTPSGRECRFLKSTVQRNQDSEPWQFWFCRGDDGGWRISTN